MVRTDRNTVFSNHDHLSFLGPGLLLQEFRPREFVLLNITDLLFRDREDLTESSKACMTSEAANRSWALEKTPALLSLVALTQFLDWLHCIGPQRWMGLQAIALQMRKSGSGRSNPSRARAHAIP